MMRTRALISGAGIAGSTLAYWLVQGSWDVTVVERAVSTRSSGNPVDVRGPAATIAADMRVWNRLREAATGVDRLIVVDDRGRPLAELATRRRASSSEEVEVARADLAAALLDAARDRAEIVRGDSIAALAQDRAGVDVRFERGPARRFDLVVGADGLHSNVRRLVFGPETRFSRPFGMFVGTVRTTVPVADPHAVLLYNRPGLSLSVHPAGGRPLAAFIFRSAERFDPRDAGAGKELVEAAYREAAWVAPQALANWRATDDVYFDVVARIGMPRWSEGRIAVVGDAADCISLLGEGSSNAILGAHTLARALATDPRDLAGAFAVYEATHRKHLRRYLRGASVGARFLVPRTGYGIRLRNAGLRLLTPRHRGVPQEPMPPS